VVAGGRLDHARSFRIVRALDYEVAFGAAPTVAFRWRSSSRLVTHPYLAASRTNFRYACSHLATVFCGPSRRT
jgi:hypothetical protein